MTTHLTASAAIDDTVIRNRAPGFRIRWRALLFWPLAAAGCIVAWPVLVALLYLDGRKDMR